MKITCASGKTLDGIPVSRYGDCIRVAVPGCDDVVEFAAGSGMWLSEDLEPVLIEFAWDRLGSNDVVTEADCICPKGLASILIQLLQSGSQDSNIEERPKVLSAGGSFC
jgi:hypothetical protein